MRTLKIVAVGVSKSSNRPWVKGVSDATSDEQLVALKNSVDTKGALFGFVRGLPDAAAAKLVPGDILSGAFDAKIVPATYEKDGEVKASLDITFFASGNITRQQPATATCDW